MAKYWHSFISVRAPVTGGGNKHSNISFCKRNKSSENWVFLGEGKKKKNKRKGRNYVIAVINSLFLSRSAVGCEFYWERENNNAQLPMEVRPSSPNFGLSLFRFFPPFSDWLCYGWIFGSIWVIYICFRVLFGNVPLLWWCVPDVSSKNIKLRSRFAWKICSTKLCSLDRTAQWCLFTTAYRLCAETHQQLDSETILITGCCLTLLQGVN